MILRLKPQKFTQLKINKLKLVKNSYAKLSKENKHILVWPSCPFIRFTVPYDKSLVDLC